MSLTTNEKKVIRTYANILKPILLLENVRTHIGHISFYTDKSDGKLENTDYWFFIKQYWIEIPSYLTIFVRCFLWLELY